MSGSGEGRGPAVARGLGALALLAVYAALFAWSDGKWPDVLVDFGRELYVPWRLVEGDVLYRDVAYFNGPLSPYWNASAFALFGVGASTLFHVNGVVLLALTGALFVAVDRSADPATATLAGVVFLCGFGFGHLVAYGNYNFVAPYSHEMVHGFALSVAALWLAARAVGTGARRDWLGCGVLLGLLFLTKAEIFLAGAAGVGACAALDRGRTGRTLGALATGAAAPVLAAACAFALAMPAADAAASIVGAWPGVLAGRAGSLQYYRYWMGVEDAGASALALAREGAALVVFAALAAALDRMARPLPPRLTAAAAFAAALAGALWADPDWMHAGRSLPLVAAAGAGLAVARWRRAGDSAARGRAALGVGFAVFALVMLAKMILFARVFHYGFALAAPAAILAVTIGMRWIPDELRRRGGGGRVFRALVAGCLVAATLGLLAVSEARYRTKTRRFGSGPDAIAVRPDGPGPLAGRADAIERALARVAALPPDATLLVVPEGVMLNYLARRRSPTRYTSFLPPELLLFGEGAIVAALDAAPPDAVLLVHKDTSEYGVPRFGRDYGRALMDWLRARYRPSGAPFGDPPLRDGSRFGLALWLPVR